MKSYRDILGSVVEIKKSYQWFTKGERWHVITREATDNSLKYELEILNDLFPKRRIWCTDEGLIMLRRKRYISI